MRRCPTSTSTTTAGVKSFKNPGGIGDSPVLPQSDSQKFIWSNKPAEQI